MKLLALVLLMVTYVIQDEAVSVEFNGGLQSARAGVAKAFAAEDLTLGKSDDLALVAEPKLLYPGKADRSSITIRVALIPHDSSTTIRLSGTYKIAYAGQSQHSGDLPITARDRNAVAKQGWKKLQALQSQLSKRE